MTGRIGPGIPTFNEIHQEAAKIEFLRHNGVVSEGEMERSLARLLGTAEAAERVKQGMIEEFGSEVAENALRNVSQTTSKDLRQGMTRRDLELLHTELHTMKVTPAKASSGPDREATWRLEGTGEPTFTQIHDALSSSDMVGRPQHLLGEKAEGDVWRLNTLGPVTPDGIGGEDLKRMLRQGARLVLDAMGKEYGFGMAHRAIGNVPYKVYGIGVGGITLLHTMTCRDVNLLHEELQRLMRPLQELRDRVPSDTEEVIKDDLTGNWRSAAKEEFYPIQGFGNAQAAGPRSMDGAKEEYCPIGDPEGGLRPTIYRLKKESGDAETGPVYGVKEEYPSIQWPDSDAKVGLRDAIHTDHLQGSEMQFDEIEGTLTLTRGERDGKEEENKKALTKFIAEHFEVEPGHSAFPNIANNILSYLPRGAVASAVDKILSVDRNVTVSQARWSRFTLSVKDENVVVAGRTWIPYVHNVIPESDGGRLEFVRQEAFEISGENLTVDPTAFNAKANLVSVRRDDTVDMGT